MDYNRWGPYPITLCLHMGVCICAVKFEFVWFTLPIIDGYFLLKHDMWVFLPDVKKKI